MSDPVWRKRVNEHLDDMDKMHNFLIELRVASDALKEEVAILKVKVSELQEKLKESRKRSKKTRSHKPPTEGMRRGKKS